MSISLPTEVYLHIIQQVHGEAYLLSLSLCCSAFRDEAQRLLFSHSIPLPLKRQRKFIDAINASPARLGPYVRTLSIEHITQDPGINIYDTPIASALRAMTGLKHLGIYHYFPMCILEGCTFSLISFAAESRVMQQSDISYLIHQFLPNQHNLRRLSVPGSQSTVDEIVSSVSICPKLDRLSVGSVSVAKALFSNQGRRVRRLQWRNRDNPPVLTVTQLNGLEYLMFSIFRRNTDTSFAQHLTSLNLLDLDIRVFSSEWVLNQIQFLVNIPCLEVLILRPWPTGIFLSPTTSPGDTMNGPTFLPIVRSAFAARVTLKYVDMYEGKEFGYRRWFPPDTSGHMQSMAVSILTAVQRWGDD